MDYHMRHALRYTWAHLYIYEYYITLIYITEDKIDFQAFIACILTRLCSGAHAQRQVWTFVQFSGCCQWRLMVSLMISRSCCSFSVKAASLHRLLSKRASMHRRDNEVSRYVACNSSSNKNEWQWWQMQLSRAAGKSGEKEASEGKNMRRHATKRLLECL